MHPVDLPKDFLAVYKPADWWAPTCPELEHMATGLIAPLPKGWMRRGATYIKIRNEFGADARTLDQELTALATSAKNIKQNGTPSQILCAATFFHLRFQRIHPLVEANGRIGRILLAGQLQSVFKTTTLEILNNLKDWEQDYNRTFSSPTSEQRFELLIDLLGRILGIIIESSMTILPASLEPLHKQREIPKQLVSKSGAEEYLKKSGINN